MIFWISDDVTHVSRSHNDISNVFVCSNRVFTEGTCKLLNLVISDLVDEDYVIHDRKQAVSALMFGTAALVSKPGQTLAPLIGTWLLSVQTGNQSGGVFPVDPENVNICLSFSIMLWKVNWHITIAVQSTNKPSCALQIGVEFIL